MLKPLKKLKKPRKREEAQIQEALIAWSRWVDIDQYDKSKGKIGDYLHATPNGGSRNIREAVALKRQGVKAGILDLQLKIMRPFTYEEEYKYPESIYSSQFPPWWGSLWIELKTSKGKLSLAQKAEIKRLFRTRHYAVVAHSLEEAKQAILDYLNHNPSVKRFIDTFV